MSEKTVHNEISESEGSDYWPSKHERSESDFVDSENDVYDTVEEDGVIFVTSSVQENLGFMPNQSALVCVSSDSHNGAESLRSASSYDSTDHSKKQRFHEFNTEKDMTCPSLKKNLIFATKEILRDAIRQYGRVERFSMSFKKNDNRRVQAVCSKGSCSWVLWASKLNPKDPNDDTWARKLVVEKVLGCFTEQYSKIYEYLGEGYILTVVGIDANDCIYPIAVGLVDSILELYPNVEHITCVRHLHSNFKNVEGYKGKALKDSLWKASRATTVRDFDRAMSEIRGTSEDACNWLKSKDAAMWSKSHFSIRSKCDLLLNNFSECFNKMIMEARNTHILTIMEIICTKMMHRFSKKGEDIQKSSGLLCPKIQKNVDTLIRQAVRCWPSHAGGLRFEVAFGPSDQHVVDLKVRDCSCRKWGLTGIPCAHAVSVMLLIQERPENYVDNCYHSLGGLLQQLPKSHFPPPQQQPSLYQHLIKGRRLKGLQEDKSHHLNNNQLHIMWFGLESASFTVIGAEAPSACHMAPRTKNVDQIAGGITAVNVPLVSDGLTGSTEKKKRGRPRKYGPDGTMTRALSPMPISSSILSVSGEFSSGGKQGRGRGSGYQIKHHKGMDMENLGDLAGTSVGTNFTPHIITFNPGEAFSNTGKRWFC
ncbi:Detected protein of unknown function [Hibiscus syriacus]|uniref:SWIM-type domain-containing protein n=1 Tax=Hibiscus syriacus TaxID=106335 RepID=A0A6A3CZC3_HIBSY|nr:Detected protein of unknown function [Hibiscus syriacus]